MESIEEVFNRCYSLSAFAAKYGLRPTAARAYLLNRMRDAEKYVRIRQHHGGYVIEILHDLPDDLVAKLKGKPRKPVKKK